MCGRVLVGWCWATGGASMPGWTLVLGSCKGDGAGRGCARCAVHCSLFAGCNQFYGDLGPLRQRWAGRRGECMTAERVGRVCSVQACREGRASRRAYPPLDHHTIYLLFFQVGLEAGTTPRAAPRAVYRSKDTTDVFRSRVPGHCRALARRNAASNGQPVLRGLQPVRRPQASRSSRSGSSM